LDYIDNIHYIIYTIASIVIVTCNVTVEESAKGFVADSEYKENTRRKQRRKTFFDEADSVVNSSEVVSLTAREQFRISSFNVVLDSLAVELRKRLEAFSKLYELFGFLTQFKSMTYEEVKKCASNLVLYLSQRH